MLGREYDNDTVDKLAKKAVELDIKKQKSMGNYVVYYDDKTKTIVK